MEDIFLTLSKFCTKETVTVVAALATAWLGFKAAAKGYGIVSNLATRVSFIGLTATVMFIMGLCGAGVGVGELAGRWNSTPQKTDVEGLSDEQLITLAGKVDNASLAETILQYAKVRDSGGEIKAQTVANMVAQTNAENKEAVLEFLKLLNNTERKPISARETGIHFTSAEKPKEIEIAPSTYKPLMSLPTVFGLLFAGVGMAITSMFVYGSKKE